LAVIDGSAGLLERIKKIPASYQDARESARAGRGAPSCDFGLLPSGQIKLSNLDGWQQMTHVNEAA